MNHLEINQVYGKSIVDGKIVPNYVDTDSVYSKGKRDCNKEKLKLNVLYGKNKDKYYNAMFEACYCEQIIDEACNGDLGFNNHFRQTLSLDDCVKTSVLNQKWLWYAETL